MEEFKTIDSNFEVEITEKKSKFLGHLFYVESQKEAEEIIKNVKKKFFDARHNCYAYRIIEKNENNKIQIISKSSDDGEPSGTAGGPMLNILEKNELNNVLIIVTRYFGGILLGTGGLVKAYSEATFKALDNVNTKVLSIGYEAEVILEYKNIENFKYYCRKNDIKIINEDYLENVKLIIEIKENDYKILENIVNDEYNNKKLNIISLKEVVEKYI